MSTRRESYEHKMRNWRCQDQESMFTDQELWDYKYGNGPSESRAESSMTRTGDQ